jgi:hypothetical protein
VTGGGHHLDVIDPRALLHALLPRLAGGAHIALEGRLADLHLDLATMRRPIQALRRQTMYPPQDFLVAPLERSTVAPVLEACGRGLCGPRGLEPLIHVQVEKDGTLQMQACDNFDPDCTWVGPAVPVEVLQALVNQGVLRGFAPAQPAG